MKFSRGHSNTIGITALDLVLLSSLNSKMLLGCYYLYCLPL